MMKAIDIIVFALLLTWTIYFLLCFGAMGSLEHLSCVPVGTLAMFYQLKRLEE